MKRVKYFTAVGKHTTIKLTMEITTNRGTAWDRKSFLELVEGYAGRAMVGLADLGFPLTKIKQK